MALVSYKYNFAFIHVYRTGGNSLRTMLRSQCDCKEILDSHISAKDLCLHEPELFMYAWKFAIVRNPYSWLVSLYNLINMSTTHPFHARIKESTFSAFLVWWVYSAPNVHKCISDFTHDDYMNAMVDYVGKFETYKDSVKVIGDMIGMDITTNLCHINSTAPVDYRTFYNSHDKHFVEEHFQKDLQLFEYTF